MEAQDKPSKRQANVQIWKLVAYFVVVVLFTYLSRRFFLQLDLESWSAFKKVTQLINETANVTQRRDDIIVTTYSLTLTLLGVIPVGWVYMITKDEEGYDQSLVQTLIVLGLTVCGVMMMLQDNLARAFGFLGVVSAVRYRNTLKDPKDAVYVFVALGIGMGCGLGVYHIAAWLSLYLCLVFLMMWKLKIGQSRAASVKNENSETKLKKNKSKKHDQGTDIDGVLALLSDETRQAVKDELLTRRAETTDGKIDKAP
jgi:hypothetical protein